MINKLFIFFRVLIAYWKKIIIDCVGLRSCEKLKERDLRWSSIGSNANKLW